MHSRKIIFILLLFLLSILVIASTTTHTNVLIRESATMNQSLDVGLNATINGTLLVDNIQPRTGSDINLTGGLLVSEDINMNQSGAINVTGTDCIIFNNGFEICGS